MEPRPPEQESKNEFRVAIEKLLVEQSFTLNGEARDKMLKQIEKNERYISVLGVHNESGVGVKRFLKIPIWESEEMGKLFERQIRVGKFLKEQGIKTRDIVAENHDRKNGLPFAIMETYEKGEAEVGFISQFAPEEMKPLTPEIAQHCIETLEQLHHIDADMMPTAVASSLRDLTGKTEEFFELIVRQDLERRVSALDTGGEAVDYGSVLDRRLGVTGFHKKVLGLLAAFREVIKGEEKKEKVLFHGDLSPDNLYIHDDNTIELLDLEWAGIHDNEAIATIIDYGNLRARVWNNKEFRDALDAAVIDKYKREGKEELGWAVVALGILRSDIQIGGNFENYPREKQSLDIERQRRESTEADLLRAFELAGITLDTVEDKIDFVPAKGLKELLAKMETEGLPRGELLQFNLGENADNLTVYNPTPMVIDGVTYLWARVEDRSRETGSKSMLFEEGEDGVWNIVEGAPVFDNLQDPFYCGFFNGRHIFGGVQIYKVEGSKDLGYRTAFYNLGESFTDVLSSGGKTIEPLAVGPEKMKGIRLIQLEEGRIGVFTRPQGDFGGRGKVGYFEINHIDELKEALTNFDRLKDPSTFVYGLFIDDEWGGPNQPRPRLLPGGKIGIVGHIAGFGDEKYTTADGSEKAKKDYYPITYIFDRKTNTVSNVQIIATTEQFPEVEAKQAQLGKILYSGGLVNRGDGYAWLYLGIGDTKSGRILIKDPFGDSEF
ncbi:MAG: DUF1861 family protein [Microgenomates group bacterium]